MGTTLFGLLSVQTTEKYNNYIQRCNSLLFKKPEMPQKCEKATFAYTFVHETVTEKT